MSIYRKTMSVLRLSLLGSMTSILPFGMGDGAAIGQPLTTPPAAVKTPSEGLLQTVRDATQQFLDINVATGPEGGYGQFLGCVSGPDAGAMGVHFVNGDLVSDPQLDPMRPEALIYEFSNGRARLVGVEFIVDAAAWLANNNNQPPVLLGQTLQFVDSPNRFNLKPFFELHVWAWRDNPNGAFVDWNPKVSCAGQ